MSENRRIEVECAKCAWRFDGTNGLICPHCRSNRSQVRWPSDNRDSPLRVCMICGHDITGYPEHNCVDDYNGWLPGIDSRMDRVKQALDAADKEQYTVSPFGRDKGLIELERIWNLTDYDPRR